MRTSSQFFCLISLGLVLVPTALGAGWEGGGRGIDVTGTGPGARAGVSIEGRGASFNPANAFGAPMIPQSSPNITSANFGSYTSSVGNSQPIISSLGMGSGVSMRQGGAANGATFNSGSRGGGVWQAPTGRATHGGGSFGGNPQQPVTFNNIDWRHIDDNNYRRRLYYQSFYRYYPYPLVNVYADAYPDAYVPAAVAAYPSSTADYDTAPAPVNDMNTADAAAQGAAQDNSAQDSAATQAAVDDARGPWVPGHYAEVPIENLIPDQTVDVYHPAVYRQRPDGSLEKMEDASVSKEPKVKIVLTRRWIEGHYANQPPPMPEDAYPAAGPQTEPDKPAADTNKPATDKTKPATDTSKPDAGS